MVHIGYFGAIFIVGGFAVCIKSVHDCLLSLLQYQAAAKYQLIFKAKFGYVIAFIPACLEKYCGTWNVFNCYA